MRVVAVVPSTGTFGVGICPGTAYRHLIGNGHSEKVRYFITQCSKTRVVNHPSLGWVPVDGVEFERQGGLNEEEKSA